jgi:hypothetical protein
MSDAAPAASGRGRGAGGGFALSSLPSSTRDAIRGLDKDGSGFVEEAEFVAAVEQMVQQRRESRLLKQILAAVVVLSLLLAAAVVGCVWGLVAASVDDTESAGGALVDKGTGAPLRTAAGFVAVGTSVEADADVLALWAEPDGAATPTRYLPFEGVALVYEKSVNASAVARACALVDEGRDQMVVANVLAGTKRTLHIDVAACPAGGGAAGAEMFVHYKGRGLLVRCPADSGEGGACHLFSERPGSAADEGAGAAAPRSYLGPNAARAPVRVFAGALELRCDAGGECRGGGASARRRLLGGYSCPNCAGDTGGDAACLVCCYPCESNCQQTFAGCYSVCNCYTRDLDCFPADAQVALEGGGAKAMAELAIGDRVLAADAAGRLFFDDVAFFGHREPAASAPFVAVTTESGAVLRLSPGHFLPAVADAACAAAGAGADLWAARELLPARAVTTAHRVWVAGVGGKALRLEKVARVALAEHAGLFNPYTLSGSIVVDGVAASCHSSWIMDAAFAALGVSIPAGYQALFAPLRALYRAVGPAAAEWLQGTAGAAVIEATLGLGRAPTGAPGQRLASRHGPDGPAPARRCTDGSTFA